MKGNIDSYIEKRQCEKLHTMTDKLRGMSIDEAERTCLSVCKDKEIVKKVMKEAGFKRNFFRSIYSKLSFNWKESPTVSIAAGMIIVFIIAVIIFTVPSEVEKEKGSCPFVSLEDVRKIGSMYLEDNIELSFVEMDQLVGAYFGKEDCTLVDKKVVKKVRLIEVN